MVSPTAVPFAVAVLAGGSSRRMGRDKALIKIDGTAMVHRVLAEAAAAESAEVVLVGRSADAFRAADGLSVVPDRFPGEGPLGGLITAISETVSDVVVLMPCDLLAPSSASVVAVMEEFANDSDADVVVPVVKGRWQYVQAGFRRSLLPILEERFAGGARSIHQSLQGLNVVELEFVDPTWCADADVPDDLPVTSQEY